MVGPTDSAAESAGLRAPESAPALRFCGRQQYHFCLRKHLEPLAMCQQRKTEITLLILVKSLRVYIALLSFPPRCYIIIWDYADELLAFD